MPGFLEPVGLTLEPHLLLGAAARPHETGTLGTILGTLLPPAGNEGGASDWRMARPRISFISLFYLKLK